MRTNHSTLADERKLVKDLSRVMLLKLKNNRQKDGWWNSWNYWLLGEAKKRMKLLVKSLEKSDPISAQAYAADVANFCQMAVDNELVEACTLRKGDK